MSTIQTLDIAKDITSKIINIYIEHTSGQGLTGLTNATANLTARYIRENDSGSNAFALAAGTLGTWGDGHFKEIDSTLMPGCYQLGLKNGIIATGEDHAKVILQGAANMQDCIIDINLTGFDYKNGRVDLKSTGWDFVILAPGFTAKQAAANWFAIICGETSGAGTSQTQFKEPDNNAVTRQTQDYDANGDRTDATFNKI